MSNTLRELLIAMAMTLVVGTPAMLFLVWADRDAQAKLIARNLAWQGECIRAVRADAPPDLNQRLLGCMSDQRSVLR